MSVHILSECPALETKRMQTLDFARMNPDRIKEARLSSIALLGKGAGLLNGPVQIPEHILLILYPPDMTFS